MDEGIHFQYPFLAILLLSIPIAILVWGWWQRKKAMVLKKWIQPASLQQVMLLQYKPKLANWQMATFSLVLFLLVLAIMNPRELQEEANVPTEGIQLMVAMDVSNSMLAEDIAPNRLEKARLFAIKLVESLPGSRIGLVAFAGEAWLQMPPSTDLSAVKQGLQTIQPEMMPVQGSNISAALEEAANSLGSVENSTKAVVLLTDGEQLEGDVLNKANELKENGVVVYALGLGTIDGAAITMPNSTQLLTDENDSVVITRLDEALLTELASNTGGSFQLLSNVEEQVNALTGTLKQLEKFPAANAKLVNYYTYAPFLMMLAFLILLVEIASRYWSNPAFLTNLKKSVGIGLLIILNTQLAQAQSEQGALKRANDAYKKAELDEAEAAYNKVIEQNPNNYLAVFNKALIQLKKGNPEAAASAFATLSGKKEATVKTVAAFNNAGLANAEAKDLAAAIDAFKKALKLDPADPDIQRNLQKALMEKQMQEPPPEEKESPQQKPKINEEAAKQKLESVMEEERKTREKMKPASGKGGGVRKW